MKSKNQEDAEDEDQESIMKMKYSFCEKVVVDAEDSSFLSQVLIFLELADESHCFLEVYSSAKLLFCSSS